MKKLFLFLLLASCRQAPSPVVIEAGPWPPPAAAVDLAPAVTMADLASPATAP